MDDAELLAKKFHETYERLAPDFGYKTRESSAVKWGDVPEKNKKLMVAVTDTGIGISPENQQKVFNDFYQLGSSLKNKTAGTGLGLPLSRRMVEMHGGEIWCESEGEGKGSRFVFTIPL